MYNVYVHILYMYCAMQFKPEMVDMVYNCAKFKYECGNYTEASEYLYFYRVLVRRMYMYIHDCIHVQCTYLGGLSV